MREIHRRERRRQNQTAQPETTHQIAQVIVFFFQRKKKNELGCEWSSVLRCQTRRDWTHSPMHQRPFRSSQTYICIVRRESQSIFRTTIVPETDSNVAPSQALHSNETRDNKKKVIWKNAKKRESSLGKTFTCRKRIHKRSFDMQLRFEFRQRNTIQTKSNQKRKNATNENI